MDDTKVRGGYMSASTQPEPWRSGRRRPLIEQCTKEWQNSTRIHDTSSLDSSSDWLDILADNAKKLWTMTKAPKFQRLAVVLGIATVLAVLCWRNSLSGYLAEYRAAWNLLNGAGKSNQGQYGQNKRVHFPGMTHVSTLDSKHLPRTSKANPEGASKQKRLIFVGDIHGCLDELQDLLEKVNYRQGQDHIIALGDMINKGPKSSEVVDLLMKNGASAVRGNNEDRILLVANELASTSLTAQVDKQEETDRVEETKAAKKNREEREVARSFSQKQLDWLNARPVILRIGDLGPLGEVVAVHGGLVPGIKLENQDPVSVMNMRIVDLATHMPSEKHASEGSVPWPEFWNKYQRLRRMIAWTKKPAAKHMTVVYGHDAKRGLQIHTYTKGLDSGCVYGRKLTAWVVSDLAKEEIVQVKCREARS